MGCVWKRIASSLWRAASFTSGAAGSSPFQAVFDAARAAKKDGLGLERWWSPADHKPVSVTVSLPFSRGEVKLKRLRHELVNYRLALGQPEPLLSEAMIEHFKLDHEEARRLALNLSPAGPNGQLALEARGPSTSAQVSADREQLALLG